jgi:hypothetical protein
MGRIDQGRRTDDVGDVLAVGEAAGCPVRREVDPVRRRVGARRGHQEVVVAAVHQRVAEHEEGARAFGRLREQAHGGDHRRKETSGQPRAHRPRETMGTLLVLATMCV